MPLLRVFGFNTNACFDKESKMSINDAPTSTSEVVWDKAQIAGTPLARNIFRSSTAKSRARVRNPRPWAMRMGNAAGVSCHSRSLEICDGWSKRCVRRRIFIDQQYFKHSSGSGRCAKEGMDVIWMICCCRNIPAWLASWSVTFMSAKLWRL
jgi:hypothetical protein